MINKVSLRKCRDCYIMLSYIPRMVRCFDCHKNYLDNAMISNKNDSEDKKNDFNLINSYNIIQNDNMVYSQ